MQRIVAGYAPEAIILFGSHAYGTPHEDSDIDLLIIKQTEKRPIDRASDIRQLLEGLDLEQERTTNHAYR